MPHANTEVLRGRTRGAEEGAPQHELGALALVALVLALLATVGLASSVSPWHASGAAVGAPTAAVRGLASVGGVVLVVAILLLWVETPITRRRKKKKKRPLSSDDLDELGTSLSASAKTVAVVLLAVAIFCIATVPLLTRASTPSQGAVATDPSKPAGLRPARGRPADHVDLGWLLVPVAVTLAILAPVAIVIRRRRLKRDEASLGETTALERAVRASIAALESERDPRRAIVLAYAHMEQAFGDVEITRARDETASEFLERTARQLPVSAGDAAVLTGRFEEARFSTHQLTEADRAQALTALRRVEGELSRRP